jgi:hypothetical protein
MLSGGRVASSGGPAGASEGQAGRRRSRAQEDLRPAAPGGRNTWGRRFVDWEIDATLEQKHGLIGVRLPTVSIVPARLQDNIQTTYSSTYSWAQITQSPAFLEQVINFAISRPKYLIDNRRDRRYRSEPLVAAGVPMSRSNG